MCYVAIINTPGYMPWEEEPPVFATPREAWEYLADERRRQEDDTEDDSYSDTVTELDKRARWAGSGLVTPSEGTGTVYGLTPGYDGDHDLGMAYSVTETDCD